MVRSERFEFRVGVDRKRASEEVEDGQVLHIGFTATSFGLVGEGSERLVTLKFMSLQTNLMNL